MCAREAQIVQQPGKREAAETEAGAGEGVAAGDGVRVHGMVEEVNEMQRESRGFSPRT